MKLFNCEADNKNTRNNNLKRKEQTKTSYQVPYQQQQMQQDFDHKKSIKNLINQPNAQPLIIQDIDKTNGFKVIFILQTKEGNSCTTAKNIPSLKIEKRSKKQIK